MLHNAYILLKKQKSKCANFHSRNKTETKETRLVYGIPIPVNSTGFNEKIINNQVIDKTIEPVDLTD